MTRRAMDFVAFTGSETGPEIRRLGGTSLCFHYQLLENAMWSKPEYTEMRFGFEVTMYIANR